MSPSTIEHVSDTALWVAAYRADESARPDAVFKDPLVAKLVGDRGREIAAKMPLHGAMALAMVVRTTAIDRLVESALAQGVDTVINLGAGLDTRPYRMKLPKTLCWVEVDFPHMIAHKNQILAGDSPICELKRIAVDLSQDAERRALLARLGSETRKALVITEGVIPYLTNEQAAVLSRDLRAVPSFQFWIMDYKQGGMTSGPTRVLSRKLKKSPFQFSVGDMLGYFTRDGWVIRENILMLDEADRIGRPLSGMALPWSWPLRLMPRGLRNYWNRMFGYVMFGR